ncbi:MAG: SiaB family protein kinase [Bacteroidota bacterium]|nr:SiaB family protein kinase [Bacteroidota bacterium]
MNFIYDLHRTMMSRSLILAYQGDVTQETTKSILTMAERSLEASESDVAIKRKVFNVMVESLQNIVRHNERPSKGVHPAIFLIGREGNSYAVMSGNPVSKKRVPSLRSALERVNSLDNEGLKDLYKNAIQDATISDKGGAGLGFIDMARKSGEKLSFEFSEMSASYCFFCLKINVSHDSLY